MSTNLITNLNLNKNQIESAAIHNLSSAPSNPVKGQIYFNTADNKMYAWDGTSWICVTLSAGDGITILNGIVSSIATSASEYGTFTTSSWTSSNGKYTLTINLTNTATNISAVFYDSNNKQVFPEDVTLVKTSGNVTAVVATIGSDPDCRFDGTYSIFY